MANARRARPPSPNQSLANHKRKPTQAIENKHQRPKSIASFSSQFCPLRPASQSLLIIHGVLIASRQVLEIELTRPQQTRKHFLIAGFSSISELAA